MFQQQYSEQLMRNTFDIHYNNHFHLKVILFQTLYKSWKVILLCVQYKFETLDLEHVKVY